MVIVACFEKSKYTEVKPCQRMVFLLVFKEGKDMLLYSCSVDWENWEVEKCYLCLYIKDFLESASSKFLLGLLDGRSGAWQKMCWFCGWSGVTELAITWY